MIDRRGEVWETYNGRLYLLTNKEMIRYANPGYGWRLLELCGPTDGSCSDAWKLVNEIWLTENMTRFA